MKFLLTIFTIIFVSSLFILSAHAIETGVSDEVSATRTKDDVKSASSTGIHDRSSVTLDPEMSKHRHDNRKQQDLKKGQQSRWTESKEDKKGSTTNSTKN